MISIRRFPLFRLAFFFPLLAALLFWSPQASASRVGPMPYFQNETIVPAGANAAQNTHDALIQAAKARGWTVVHDKGNRLRLRLDVRNKHTVVIDLKIKGGTVSVDYVDSVNMNYHNYGPATSPKSGDSPACLLGLCDDKTNSGEVIHPNYGGWIRKLLQSARAAAR